MALFKPVIEQAPRTSTPLAVRNGGSIDENDISSGFDSQARPDVDTPLLLAAPDFASGAGLAGALCRKPRLRWGPGVPLSLAGYWRRS